MKFSHKLTLAVLSLLGILFTLGGTVLVTKVFQNAVQTTVSSNTTQHLLEKYTLESDMLSTKKSGYPLNNDYFAYYIKKRTGYMGSSGQFTALYDKSGNEIYTNFTQKIPQKYIQETLAVADENYLLRQVDQEFYMLIASTVHTGKEQIKLLTMYSVSSVYAQREQNLLFFWQLDAVMLLFSFGVTVALSLFLTKPIIRLNHASQHIASGNYSERVAVTTSDETGELAQSFNQMADAVEEKIDAMELSMQQKDDFVSAFTHEIKTPMTTLIGYSKILRTKECEPAVRQRAATAIYFEAKRLEALSQSLLQLMGLGEASPQLVPVSLQEILSSCQRSLPKEATKDIIILYEAAQCPVVLAQPDLLLDLIRNLILNAMAAQPKDKQITVKTFLQNGKYFVKVCDTGTGIPPEEIPRLCEPFYMVDRARSRKEGSSGLGLSIAQRIAKLHGSQLFFESKLGEGTCVSFSLTLFSRQSEAEL